MSERWVRAGLIVLAASALVVGVWAQFFPLSFYEDFPGPRSWVSVDGPYNEHLIRDVGGLNLALAVLTIVGARTLRPLLVTTTAVAWLASSVPHLVYHAHHLEGLSGPDQVGVLVSLTITVVVPALLLARPIPASTDVGTSADREARLRSARSRREGGEARASA